MPPNEKMTPTDAFIAKLLGYCAKSNIAHTGIHLRYEEARQLYDLIDDYKRTKRALEWAARQYLYEFYGKPQASPETMPADKVAQLVNIALEAANE